MSRRWNGPCKEERECAERLQQVAAVRGAANGLIATVLEGYVNEHAGSDHRRDREILLSVIAQYLK